MLIRAYRNRQGEFPFDKPYYLLIDMLLGGACIGEVDSLALPVEMKVGRVRYYRQDGEISCKIAWKQGRGV